MSDPEPFDYRISIFGASAENAVRVDEMYSGPIWLCERNDIYKVLPFNFSRPELKICCNEWTFRFCPGGANPAISNKCVSSQSMPRSCPPYNPRCSKMFQMSWSISWPKFNLAAIKHWRCILGKTKMEQECKAHVLKSHASNHWRLADFNMENYSLISRVSSSPLQIYARIWRTAYK